MEGAIELGGGGGGAWGAGDEDELNLFMGGGGGGAGGGVGEGAFVKFEDRGIRGGAFFSMVGIIGAEGANVAGNDGLPPGILGAVVVGLPIGGRGVVEVVDLVEVSLSDRYDEFPDAIMVSHCCHEC